ncbi:MAG: hypothetical protein H6613_13870 [Ignavibacteriales bacterium]|nr:hypothetical protein [Ignavibacteriales bacterium]
MVYRFYFQLIVGLAVILAILFFGNEGVISILLFVLLPFLKLFTGYKVRDERELQMFYKIGNYTLLIVIAAVVIVNKFSSTELNNNLIGDFWAPLTIASIFFGQGIIEFYSIIRTAKSYFILINLSKLLLFYKYQLTKFLYKQK